MRFVSLLVITLASICAVIIGVWVWKSKRMDKGVCPHTITIKSQRICVEVADTDVLRERGLSGHAPLLSHQGMLFVFDFPARQTFWMKEMLFPLDFVWIKRNQVADLTTNVPAPDPNTPLPKLPVYSPSGPVDKVLEINAGTVAAWGIATGDAVMVQ